MASASFRDSMNSLGWSRREPEAPATNRSSTGMFSSLQSLNPFADRGYVQLPTQDGSGAPLPAPTRREEEEGWFSLTRWDRMLLFAGCMVGALVCFSICIGLILFPLIFRPRKFAVLWSVGSILFLTSWAILMGPVVYIKHLVSGARLPFTAAYFISIALTLYFALGLHSTILTLISSIFQLVALIWYLVSYFPMGSTGLRLAARVGGGRVTAWMND
ncbi:protein transport protein sft2 [Onygenales sp. PD_40]|nr:protein transport protein sft2 [Onygenales sp. PD_40]KAK2771061.1 protein transport protein sft2 [Emmonsiellopsis sp. PD_33]KAK2791099.1 protein transport protein sft2 [Onygenales sp. PD_12]KAK2799674.1 protein transport protein sft2 [Onygenales sp. PD_10]